MGNGNTARPTRWPTRWPTTKRPTNRPTKWPTRKPTTRSPTKNPTKWPTTKSPTKNPTKLPTAHPTANPTVHPAVELDFSVILENGSGTPDLDAVSAGVATALGVGRDQISFGDIVTEGGAAGRRLLEGETYTVPVQVLYRVGEDVQTQSDAFEAGQAAKDLLALIAVLGYDTNICCIDLSFTVLGEETYDERDMYVSTMSDALANHNWQTGKDGDGTTVYKCDEYGVPRRCFANSAGNRGEWVLYSTGDIEDPHPSIMGANVEIIAGDGANFEISTDGITLSHNDEVLVFPWSCQCEK